MTYALLSPLQLGPYRLHNRLVMAPLTRNRASTSGVPTDMMITYYAQRASAGLIISEGAQIAEDALGYPCTPGIYNAEQIQGWRAITDAVHARDGRIFLQLWHCGRVSHSSLLPDGNLPVAPSAIRPAGEAMTYSGPQAFETPQALSLDGIARVIEQYRHAAACALEAGFDGVEIHAANGYLLDQFLRDGSNHRSDAYGGSIEGRCKLLREVTEVVCAVWGAERVGVRLSPLQPFNDMYDSNPKAVFSAAVTALNAYNLAYLHVTEMGVEQPGVAGPAFDLSCLRALWEGCYITNSQYDFARGEVSIANGDADAIAYGRLFIANPDLVERFAAQAPLNEPDTSSFYGGDATGYIDYPAWQQP